MVKLQCKECGGKFVVESLPKGVREPKNVKCSYCSIKRGK